MTNIAKTEIEHVKNKVDEIKAKIEGLLSKSGHEAEIQSLHFELDDLVNRINSLLPH